jgi:CBS domain-containing protein
VASVGLLRDSSTVASGIARGLRFARQTGVWAVSLREAPSIEHSAPAALLARHLLARASAPQFSTEVCVKISEVMSRDVQTTTPEETLRNAATRMKQIDAGVLPVREGDKLVGMLTDRDIAVRGIAEGKGPDAKVHDVMTPEVKYVFDDQEVEEVAQNMSDLQVRRLPVVNRDKRLVGIISLGDIATEGSVPKSARALHGISQPGGQHN